MKRGRHKRPLMNVVGGLGIVLAMGGILNIYPLGWGIFLAFAAWILGAVVVNFLFG